MEIIFVILSGVRLFPLGTAATTDQLYQPRMIDDGDCGAVGGTKIGRGNRSTRRRPAPLPLYLTQIPHEQTRATDRLSYVRPRCVEIVQEVVRLRKVHYLIFALRWGPRTRRLQATVVTSIEMLI